eukprot:1185355-Prorocentrum_minimum.AAC.1
MEVEEYGEALGLVKNDAQVGLRAPNGQRFLGQRGVSRALTRGLKHIQHSPYPSIIELLSVSGLPLYCWRIQVILPPIICGRVRVEP